MDWPGPGYAYRPRQSSAHINPQPVYYTGPNGQLLVPAGSGGLHRSNSAAGYRPPPAQVIIENNNVAWEDTAVARRPRSTHGHHHYYREEEYSDRERYSSRERSRSRSRVRVRTPSPYYESEYEIKARLKRLDELEKKEADERRKRQLEEELILEAVKKEKEHAERKKEEDELKKKAILEYEAKQAAEKEKKRKAEEETNKEYRERMWNTLHNNGYTDDEIEDILKRGEMKKDGHHAHGPAHAHVVHDAGVVALARPTYIKVNKKYLDPYTLDVYELDWEWDEVSSLIQPWR